MESILQDIRYGFRVLLKHNFAFTIAATLTLGLGVGATTAIFSVVNSILLRPLPYNDSKKLVTVYEQNLSKGLNKFRASSADFIDWRDQNQVFSNVAAIRFKTFLLTRSSAPEWLSGGAVSTSLFSLLGVEPVLGQSFLPEHEQAPNSNVVIISYGLWERGFGNATDIVGTSLTLDGVDYSVIGVMPAVSNSPRSLIFGCP